MGFDIQKIISDIVGNVSGGVSSASETIANFAKTDQGKIIIGGIAGRIAGTSAGIDPNTAAISGAAGVSERITKRRDQDKVIKANQDAATKRNEFQAKQQTERLEAQERISSDKVAANEAAAQIKAEAKKKQLDDKKIKDATDRIDDNLKKDSLFNRRDIKQKDKELYRKAKIARELGFKVKVPILEKGAGVLGIDLDPTAWFDMTELRDRKIVEKQLKAINLF